MKKDLIVYTILLIFGLIGAYYVSVPREDFENKGLSWFNVDFKNINKVTYNSKNKAIEVILKKDNLYVVKYNDLKAKKEKTFRTNKNFEHFLKFFNPLYVVRKIGKIKDKDLQEYGINNESDLLSVISNQRSLQLKIGKYAYGTSNVYVMDIDRKEIALIDGSLISQLQQADLFYFENRVVNLDLKDVDSVVIDTQQFKKEIKRVKNNTESSEISWADDPDKADTIKSSYGTWLNKLLKLNVLEYIIDENIINKIQSQQRIISVVFKQSNQIKEHIQVVKEVLDKNTITYYIYTNFLEYWVRVDKDKLDNLIQEMQTIFK